MKPGGLFLNHGIASWPGGKFCRKLPTPVQSIVQWRIIDASSFAWAYIFPDGELEPVSEVNLIAEQCGFEVRDYDDSHPNRMEGWRVIVEAAQDQDVIA